MLTVEWQPLSPLHGYVLPNDLVSAGFEPTFREAMERSEALWSDVVQLNAREAMHLIELRSSPLAGAMTFVDFADVDLERLQAERRAEGKRQLQASRNEP